MKLRHISCVLLILLGSPLSMIAREPSAITSQETQKLTAGYSALAERLNRGEGQTQFSTKVPIKTAQGVHWDRLSGDQIYVATEENFSTRFDRQNFALRFFKSERSAVTFAKETRQLTKERRENLMPETGFHFDFQPLEFSAIEALEKARNYLEKMGIPLPAHYELAMLDFGIKTKDCWLVEWRPLFNGIPFSDFAGEVPHIAVIFNKKKGLLRLEQTAEVPAPLKGEVKVTQEDAIVKGSDAALLVQKTQVYQDAYGAGFVPCAVREVALEVTAPNWILDPERAARTKDRMIEGTRVCWAVHCLTRPNTEDVSARMLPLPEIVVYIDATSGETVGADFR